MVVVCHPGQAAAGDKLVIVEFYVGLCCLPACPGSFLIGGVVFEREVCRPAQLQGGGQMLS